MIDLIILVDDNPTTIFYNEDVVLELYPNVNVVSYTNSKEFLNDFLNLKFKDYNRILLLLDLNMPDYLGYEVIEEIEEEIDELYNLSVVILTSSKLKSDTEKSTHFPQIKGYIEKPLTANKLKSIQL